MKQKQNKILIAWFILFITIAITLLLTYLKLFPRNNNIEERIINESSSNAIHNALRDITTNFNQHSKVLEYSEKENIILKASVNNYSIYISYIADVTTTYEFNYDNLCLNITINNNDEDIRKFNIVCQILIEAVQKRINNTNDISDAISKFLEANTNYDGLTKEKVKNGIKYQINITKKIK